MRVNMLAVLVALSACAGPSYAAGRPIEMPARWGRYSLDLVDEGGGALPTFQHRGRTYVLGRLGERYLVRVRNDSDRRAEVVISVDGRDVIDGGSAGFEKRGYLVEPHGQVIVDGFRLSEESVAAFRFSSVSRSYASQMGDARDVGVIGVAVFPERRPRYVPPPRPLPYRSQEDERAAPRSEAAPGKAGEAPADASPPPATALRERKRSEPRGLGTEFGEEHDSRVHRVSFERASQRPEAVLTLRYDDRDGLIAAGVDVDRHLVRSGDGWRRETAEPFRRDTSYSQPPPGWSRR